MEATGLEDATMEQREMWVEDATLLTFTGSSDRAKPLPGRARACQPIMRRPSLRVHQTSLRPARDSRSRSATPTTSAQYKVCSMCLTGSCSMRFLAMHLGTSPLCYASYRTPMVESRRGPTLPASGLGSSICRICHLSPKPPTTAFRRYIMAASVHR